MNLKTLYPLTIILLFLTFSGRSQQVRSLWLQGSTGINSVWLLNQNAYGNPEMAYATTFGFTGGLGVNYFMSRDWGVNGSASLARFGQDYSGDQSGAMANRKVKLTYVEVPLMIMRQLPYMNHPTFISAGPDLRFLVKAYQNYMRENGGQQLPNADGMIDGDITERFKPIDIAINLSFSRMAEVNYKSNLMLMFSVDSSFGLMDINKTGWQTPNTHGEYAGSHNFYIGVKVGLMFKIARPGGSNW